MKKPTIKHIPSRIIFYDIEANGRSTVTDRLLEIYMLVYDTKLQKAVRTYHSLVELEDNDVSLFIYCTTGWTKEYLNEHGRPLEKVMAEVYTILDEEEDYVLCGYNNRSYDNKILARYFRRFKYPKIDFERISFDCYIDYKAELMDLKKSHTPKNWQDIHDRVVVNHYGRQLTQMGHKLAMEDACVFYSIDVDHNQQHRAEYDAMLCFEMLKRQRPDWIKKLSSRAKRK